MTDGTPTRRAALAAAAAAAGTLLTGVRARAQDDALTELSIVEARRRMAAGSLTSVALTRTYLDRIEALNPRLNAFITVTAEAALAEAETRDAERAAGPDQQR